MKPKFPFVRLAAFLLVLGLLVAATLIPALLTPRVSAASKDQSEEMRAAKSAPYHKRPPKGPLALTLDPAEFSDDPKAYVAYSIAAKIRELLYQVPCFCPCSKFDGHESLLDCYTSTHGKRCGTCQSEVIFCYEQHKKGKSPKQIRKAMLAKQWIYQDIDKYANDYKIAMSEGRE